MYKLTPNIIQPTTNLATSSNLLTIYNFERNSLLTTTDMHRQMLGRRLTTDTYNN